MKIEPTCCWHCKHVNDDGLKCRNENKKIHDVCPHLNKGRCFRRKSAACADCDGFETKGKQ